jgi:hypothetical protein
MHTLYRPRREAVERRELEREAELALAVLEPAATRFAVQFTS